MVSSRATLTSYAPCRCWGAGCGLRQGEIFGLALEAIDFLRRVVHVRRQLRLVQNQVVLAPPKGAESGRCRCPMSSRWPWRDTSKGSALRR
jgi:integrase